MTLLFLGLVLFLGPHAIRIVADGLRESLIARFSPNGYKLAYSAVSLLGLVLIVYGYAEARGAPVVIFAPPTWTRHLAALLTIPAFVLLAAVYVPGTRIKARLGHPMVLGVKVWAFAHLLSNGTLADVCCSAPSSRGRWRCSPSAAGAIGAKASSERLARRAATRSPPPPASRPGRCSPSGCTAC